MAIRVDTALQMIPERLRRELDHEISRGKGGPFADTVLPLNAVLLSRQERIDALTARVTSLTCRQDELRRALRSVVDHWHEFGPEHGFDECLEMAARVLTPNTN
jgi:hypothetical protein